MSNYVYLYCTDFPDMPKEFQVEDFLRNSGIEYEAKACIPLFWMCLFSSADIRILPANHNGFDDDSRPYAYLFCSRLTGIKNLINRSEMLKKVLGAERHALYIEWIARLESENLQNILARTEQLDWMGEEGELEETLRKAYRHLEDSRQNEGFRMSNAMNDIAGLWENEVLSECEAFELVGSANDAQRWPQRFVEQLVTQLPPMKKSRWRFWK